MVFVTIPKGVMTDSAVKELNEELDGIAMVYCTERISHMWDGQTCIYFLNNFLSKCLALKRAKHGLTKEDRAMFVCDKAPCHLHKAFLVLRQNWGFLENAEIFGDDAEAEVEVPAGIGGVGAPNDAFHQFV